MDDSRPHTFTHWPDDLDIFAKQFAAKGIIGGMKGYSFPNNGTWLTGGRYLLTKVTDSVIMDLFNAQQVDRRIQQYWGKSSFLSRHFPQVAAYLAGILGKRTFLPEILRLLEVAKPGWYDTGSVLALHLLRGKETEAEIEILAKQKGLHKGATLALRLLRTDSLLDHLGGRVKRQVQRGTIYAHRLVGGLEYKNASELQQKLTRLLTVSTPPSMAMGRHLTYVFPRSFEAGLTEVKHYTGELSTSLPIHSYRVERLGQLPAWDDSATTIDWRFTKAVQHYLKLGGGQALLGSVIGPATGTPHAQDLIGGLEVDWQYHLPAEVIQIVYERLLTLLPSSDYLYEAYAYALLCRGDRHDAQAKRLLERSQQLQSEFHWVLDRGRDSFPVAPGYALQSGERCSQVKGTMAMGGNYLR